MRSLIERAQPYCWALAVVTTLIGVLVLAGRDALDGAPLREAVQHAASRLPLAFATGVGEVWVPAAIATAILLPFAVLLRCFFTYLLTEWMASSRDLVRAMSAVATLAVIAAWLLTAYDQASPQQPPSALGLLALSISLGGVVAAAHVPDPRAAGRGPAWGLVPRLRNFRAASCVLAGSQFLAMLLAALA